MTMKRPTWRRLKETGGEDEEDEEVAPCPGVNVIDDGAIEGALYDGAEDGESASDGPELPSLSVPVTHALVDQQQVQGSVRVLPADLVVWVQQASEHHKGKMKKLIRPASNGELGCPLPSLKSASVAQEMKGLPVVVH